MNRSVKTQTDSPPGDEPTNGQPSSFLLGSGAAYLAARYGLGVLVGVGNMLVLTWWIGPRAYGLFVTAIGLVAFFASIARLGVDTYLVRRDKAPDLQLYATAGTFVLAFSLLLMIVAAAVIPFLISWFGGDEFVTPYLVLLLSIPVTGLTGVPTAKLERELQFRRAAQIELAGQLVGLTVSFFLAWRGFGVWAAVAGQTAWQLSLMIFAHAYARLPVAIRIDLPEMRRMLAYGSGITISLRMWQLRTLVNPLLVGRFAGAEGVAFVALAIRIAEALGSIRQATGRVAVASLSRLQHDVTALTRTLEESLHLQVILLGPLLCMFSLTGPFVVNHLVGKRWTPSLSVYPFVALGVLVNSVYNLQAAALFVRGATRVVTRSYFMHIALLGAGTYLLLPHLGIVGYGWAEVAACGGYARIHRAFTKSLSYRKLAPLTLLFGILLFLPWAIGNRNACLLTSIVALGATGARARRYVAPGGRLLRRTGRSLRAMSTVLVCLGGIVLSTQSVHAETDARNIPLNNEVIPPTFFGMHFRLDKIDWPGVPFGALRLWDTDTNWQRMNPEIGKYDFSVLDRYLAVAKNHQLEDVMLTLGGTPQWASADPTDRSCDYSEFAPGSCHPPSDLNPDGSGTNHCWRDFLHALGTHLAGLNAQNHASVKYFSVWNEFTRGAESHHPSWLGTDEQMWRMTADAGCILLGRGVPGQRCTSTDMHEPAVGLLPFAKVTTPDAVSRGPRLRGFADSLQKNNATSSIEIIAVHSYAYVTSGLTSPDTGPSGLPAQWSEIQNILPTALHNLPIWSTESGWGDTVKNLPDQDLQQGYVARYYLVGWSLGFRRLYWYAGDNSWGRLIYPDGIDGCHDKGPQKGCQTTAAYAWKQVYRWMVGNRMVRNCAAENSSSLWTCELAMRDGRRLLAVWDTAQSCSGGYCTASAYFYPKGFRSYFILSDDKCRPLPKKAIQIGWKPVLLCESCDE